MLILNGSQLDDWELVLEHSVSQHADYRKWHTLCERHYEATLRQNPQFEARFYQVSAAAAYCLRPFNICAGAPGIGKTLISALVMAAVYSPLEQRRRGSIHVVVPNWLSAHSRWAVDLNRVPALAGQVAVLEKTKDLPAAPIWVYSHDFLKRQGDRRDDSLIAYWYAHHCCPSFLVVDEIHNFQPKRQRTARLWELRRHVKRCLTLSGTLSDGRFDLLQQTLSLTYGRHWPYTDSKVFLSTYGVKTKISTASLANFDAETEAVPQRYLERVSLSKLPAYYRTLRRYVHRLTFGDPKILTCCSLPQLRVQQVEVEPSDYQRITYRAAVSKDYARLQQLAKYGRTIKDRAEALNCLQPLLMVTNTPSFALAKWQKLRQIVREALACERKVVIFCTSVDTARDLSELLESAFAHRVTRLYASDPLAKPATLSMEARLERLDRLQHDPNTAVGVLSIYLAAESIDLTACSVVIFWELPWQTLKVQQAICRARRPGAVYPQVDVYYLTTAGLLDAYMYELTQTKLQHSRLLLDFVQEETPVAGENLNPLEVLSSLLWDPQQSQSPLSLPPLPDCES